MAGDFDINFSDMTKIVSDATTQVKTQLAAMTAKKSAISVVDMFNMQMTMNHLSQLSEMSTSVMSAANTTIASMARNVKS